MIEFFMAMNPPTATAQEKKFNRETGKVYLKSEAKAARGILMAHLAEFRPKDPIIGPVEVEIMWLYKNSEKKDGTWHTAKPDLDNIEKDLLDCMVKMGFFPDDKFISRKITEKRWTTNIPGIYIKVRRLKEGQR